MFPPIAPSTAREKRTDHPRLPHILSNFEFKLLQNINIPQYQTMGFSSRAHGQLREKQKASSQNSTPRLPPAISNMEDANNTTIALREPRHVPYQEKPFECTYPDCHHRFETLKGMQRHKKYDEDHFYCKRCDLDCHSWEELTAHKVDNMAPYVEGKRQPTPEDMPKHIVCEFCGEDFKSFGGRNIHRETMHKADQSVYCPGCGTDSIEYVRAAHMIQHIENGECLYIRARDLISNIQQKHWNKQVMVNPELFSANLAANKLSSEYPGLIDDAVEEYDDNDGEEEVGGGVSILDQQYPTQKGGVKPLQPDGAQTTTEESPKVIRAWPQLQAQDTQRLTGDMRNMSIGSSSDTRSASSQKTAWGGKNTSKALFPKAKPTPPAGNWEAILEHQREIAAENDDTNLLKARIWDRDAKGYDVDRFFNQAIGMYCCPFPECTEGLMPAEYDTPSDLESHILYAHTVRVYKCCTCHKRFNTVAGLVAHVENTRKCAVRESGNFNQFLDDITGGFLMAKEKRVPKIVRPGHGNEGNELVKKGQSLNGIQKVEYSGKRPNW